VAQRILEKYIEPEPHDPEQPLDRHVEVPDRPEIVFAVDGLQRENVCWSVFFYHETILWAPRSDPETNRESSAPN
jgi:hypothetical protein